MIKLLIFLGFWVGLGALLGIIHYRIDKDGYNYIGPEPSVGVGIIGGFIVAIIAMFLFTENKKSELKIEERIYAKYSINSLDANEDLNGGYSQAFFVGSGYIGEDLYYHFFYNTKKGIKYEKRFAEEVYLIETDTIKPSYIRYGNYYKEKDSLHLFYHPNRLSKTRDVLYIPKGTLNRNYKIN